MNAQEAAGLSLRNASSTEEAKAYDKAIESITAAAQKGERRVSVMFLPHATVTRLRIDGYSVEQGDGAVDARDAHCFTITW